LAKGQPPLIYFWYRQSPEPLIVSSPFSYVSPDDPPPIVSDMIGLNLDPQGRLLQLDAVPPQVEEKPSVPTPFDWKALFTAAGLDLTHFTPAEPQWISLAPFDARAAWTLEIDLGNRDIAQGHTDILMTEQAHQRWKGNAQADHFRSEGVPELMTNNVLRATGAAG
jgi:hypothetical protein